jgi:hypothetical protein
VDDKKQPTKTLSIKFDKESPQDLKVWCGYVLFGICVSSTAFLFGTALENHTIRKVNKALAYMIQQQEEEGEG